MNVKEFRVGNWFKADMYSNKVVHEQMTGKDILELEQDEQDDYYQPIELTEEILLKCGFKKETECQNAPK